jgi:peptidyl-prolyl cis-trans isomerase-like protein 2
MFIRRGEYDAEWGGKGRTTTQVDRPLSFDCCELSLQQFQDPACSPDGHIFDMANIFAWLKKYKVNPVTGEKMTAKDLIVLNMFKNAEGKWACPVTRDVFSDGSHIVAIKTTGNVFSYEAVKRLNIERKDWKDLSSGETFARSDIIHLHDPSDHTKKLVKNFYHIVKQIDYKADEDNDVTKKMNLNRTTAEIIATARAASASSASSAPVASSSGVTPTPSYAKQGATASFTATNVEYAPVVAKPELAKRTSQKGRVQLVTNFGTLELVLHCDLCPKTCENFLLLIDSGFYDGVTFHRSIKNFMLQGGDPDGTGKGGRSAWGEPFEDEIVSSLKHDGRGVLSMANRGPNTNTSQFFILYKSAPHLDGKHTVFGKLTQESFAVLKVLEAIDTDDTARPKEPIRIIKAGIIENPLDSHALEAERAQETAEKSKQLQLERDRSERGLWYSNPSSMPSSSSSTQKTVGKYITPAPNPPQPSNEKKRSLTAMDAPPPAKRQKSPSGWSVF